MAVVEITPYPPTTLDATGMWEVNFNDRRYVGLTRHSIWDVFAYIGEMFVSHE